MRINGGMIPIGLIKISLKEKQEAERLLELKGLLVKQSRGENDRLKTLGEHVVALLNNTREVDVSLSNICHELKNRISPFVKELIPIRGCLHL
jgi:hypothetical protein